MESSTESRPAGLWASRCIDTAKSYLILDTESMRATPDAVWVRVIGPPRPMPWSTVLKLVYKRLVSIGCYPRIVKTERGVSLVIIRRRDKGSRHLLGLGLALLTLLSVYLSGEALVGGVSGGSGFAWSPVGYLVALLIPLLLHELGHWSVLRRYSTPASIPYLLPAPPLQLGFLGTFGAVINLRWLPPTDRALALSAIMGPLTGFVAALPFAYIGVKNSVILPASAAGAGIPLVPLIMLLMPLPRGVGPHEAVILSPVGFAAFVVFFVTFLNLIPVASLDGGHIIRAILGFRWHKAISYAATAILLAASIRWPMLSLFSALALAFLYLGRKGHPGSAMGVREPGDPVLALVGVVYVALLILTLPVPVG